MKSITVRNLVIGSGAAGLSVACLLKKNGIDDLLLVTEGLKCGTSRNTGSDKQTYYKLSLSGSDKDSVRSLAEDLFSGGAVDGDNALVEASLSVPAFTRLTALGVLFPKNRYGEYIGYKTDHDSHKRATSAGPYTSKYMVEALIQEAEKLKVNILEPWQLIKLIVENNEVKGALFVSRITGEILLILSQYIVVATGGPASTYKNSVYPESQFGSHGILAESGVRFQNLTEWQYGLSSKNPRWNVSGSYMQALPRFISVDQKGNEHEFLLDYPAEKDELLNYIFLKGYQWPFDVRKIEKGSSIIDILVYLELEKGRKVYLDFSKNSNNDEIDFSSLSKEVYTYLSSSNALLKTPIERLKALNKPAYEFYLDKGVDLEKEYLEIALSAQHNNGGVSVSSWWESSVKNLFVIGEAAGTHGVYRPGGSALNSGQTSSIRASEMISKRNKDEDWKIEGKSAVRNAKEEESYALNNIGEGRDWKEGLEEIQSIMSLYSSAFRDRKGLERVRNALNSFKLEEIKVSKKESLWKFYEVKNTLVFSKVLTDAILFYFERNGLSRGSALYSNIDGKVKPKGLDGRFYFNLEEKKENKILETFIKTDGETGHIERFVRPIPEEDDTFEVIWAHYREDKNVY